ncbi:MAG: acyl-CoA dehydrogenase protein [Frankiales bacterium]|nr:acyl-CoA dehydrogenase protein [Frankiales bacterium]
MSDLDDLRSAVRGLLTTHAPVRAQLHDDPSVWKRLTAEMGLMSLPSEGMPFSYVCAVLEETGRVLLRAPYLSSVVAAAALHQLGDTTYAPGLADGSITAALALDGRLDQVVDGAGASILLLADGDDLLVVEDFTAEPLEPMDRTRPQARVDLTRPGQRLGTSSHARNLQYVALASESVGAAQRVVELTVEHLRVREQFGRPLGSFQALRHRVADLTVAVEAATSSAWYAARAVSASPEADLPVAAPLAKAVTADAFVRVAGESIQLHGGIGFTWEHDAHLYFKRAWTTSLMHGDSRTLRRLAFQRAGQ